MSNDIIFIFVKKGRMMFLRFVGFLLLIHTSTTAQLVEWVKSVGSPGANFAYGLTLDDGQSVITTGWFSGTVDFDPGPGVFNRTSNGGEDAYVLKLDGNGNFLWALTFGGSGADRGYDVITDFANNVYVIGNFMSSVDFDPGATLDVKTSAGSTDVFMIKVSFLGNYEWTRTWGGIGQDLGYAISIDQNGNPISAGMFSMSVDFDPGPQSILKQSQGALDIFISKFDPSGNVLWNQTIGGSESDFVYSIQCDATGNIFHGGYFSGIVDFDSGAGQSLLTALGQNDIYIQKMTANGQHLWTKGIQGVGNEFLHSIRYGGTDMLYATGNFSGTLDFNPGQGQNNHSSNGSFDAFIVSLDTNGNYVWSRTFGGTGNDLAVTASPDRSGNLNVSGLFMGTVDMDPGPQNLTRVSNGGYDVFVSKFNSSGNLLWNMTFGGTGNDEAWGIEADLVGNVHTTGPFSNSVDFDPGPATSTHTSLGQTDIFVHKIKCGSINVINISGCGSVVDPFTGLVYTKNETLVDTTTNRWECDSVIIRNLIVRPLPGNPQLQGNLNPLPFSLQLYLIGNYNPNWNYIWQVAGGTIAASAANFLNVNWNAGGTTGSIILQTITDSNCTRRDTFSVNILFGTSVDDISTNEMYNVFPIPTSKYIYIKNFSPKSTIKIFDTTGRQLGVDFYFVESNWQADLSGLKAGLYFVTIEDEGKFFYERIKVIR